MSRYKETFERLATRGRPVGATALLDRVESKLSVPVHIMEAPPRRRFPGFVVAAIAFGVVLAIGLVWTFFTAPSTDIAAEPDESGIEWIGLDLSQGFLSVTAGPGGFIRSPFMVALGGPTLEFSPDGRTWTEVEMPGLIARSGVQTVATTSDSWLVILNDGKRAEAWVSTNGVAWTGVMWPDDLDETVSQVIGSGGGFLAVSRAPFGAGTTLWWSTDGTRWSRLDGTIPGDPDRTVLWGTAAGVVWYPFESDRGSVAPIYHSVDGTTWIEGSIELPAEFTESPIRWDLSAIEYVDGGWIALGAISRTAADPVIYVWTSQDGVEWTPRGIPEFGRVENRAVIVFRYAVVADRLVVAPTVVPVSEAEDGLVTASGAHTSTGDLWATEDGVSWNRVLHTDMEIESLAGRATDDRATIGVWVGRPRTETQQTVLTTAPTVQPQELDPAGLDLQEEILADGDVTREEFERALEGWKACMEERGLVEVTFEIDEQGGLSRSYGSPDPNAGEAEDAACLHSYVNQVADALGR